MVKNRRYYFLGAWARLVAHRPKTIITVAVLLAIASITVTALKLQFQPNRNDLISPDLPWNQVFIDWQTKFPGSRDLVVVVDAGPEQNQSVSPDVFWVKSGLAAKFVSELTPRLEALPLVGNVTSTMDTADFSPKAIRLAPSEQFKNQLQHVEQSLSLLQAKSPADLLSRAIGDIRRSASSINTDSKSQHIEIDDTVKQISKFDDLIKAYGQVLESDLTNPLMDEIKPQVERQQYLTSPNGRLYFIRITPLEESGKLNALKGAIDSIQSELTNLLETSAYKDLQAGLTGIEVVEGEETAIATHDSTLATIIASVLIAILLMLAFHSVRGPMLAMVALFIAIAWSFGILTITVGHLQVISVVFTVILLGLGIDFAIHLKSSFENLRHDHDDSEEGFRDALVQTFRITGPGVLTGACTTAAAFMTTLLTDFTGVAEMGFIASVGVLLCLLAMFSVYPALLRLVKPGHEHFKPMLRDN